MKIAKLFEPVQVKFKLPKDLVGQYQLYVDYLQSQPENGHIDESDVMAHILAEKFSKRSADMNGFKTWLKNRDSSQEQEKGFNQPVQPTEATHNVQDGNGMSG